MPEISNVTAYVTSDVTRSVTLGLTTSARRSDLPFEYLPLERCVSEITIFVSEGQTGPPLKGMAGRTEMFRNKRNSMSCFVEPESVTP